jgi:O-phosphoseryl-tRNA synthetase
MGRWNSKKLVEEAKSDFDKAWKNTKILPSNSGEKERKIKIRKGNPHLIYETISKLRRAYLEMGFEEIINPLFVEDVEVKKQFGPEAVTVLDRIYYIGGLPRPDIGISDKSLQEIKDRGAKADREALKSIMRRYKTGTLPGDELPSELAKALQVDEGKSLEILEAVFPEFRKLRPDSSNITLRSHMTSGWFLSLEALYGKKDLPFRLFSIDRCFRREQKEDRGHLRSYFSASAVIIGNDVGLEDGEKIVKGLLKKFGFKDFKFLPDKKRSKYYAPDTQTEVFALSPGGEWVEIATFGLYSPVALSRYGIEHPVLNLGLGVERLAMVLSGAKDIRELSYPQFYEKIELKDSEIAGGIFIDKEPSTLEGKKIVKQIEEVARKHADDPSPCKFDVYSGNIIGRDIIVRLVEVEEGTKLLGPAALNSIIVNRGNILGVSTGKDIKEGLKEGVKTNLTYIQGLANLAAWEIEKGAEDGKKITTRVKGVKLPSDINVTVSDEVVRFINSNNKKIDIRGPVFTTIEVEFT